MIMAGKARSVVGEVYAVRLPVRAPAGRRVCSGSRRIGRGRWSGPRCSRTGRLARTARRIWPRCSAGRRCAPRSRRGATGGPTHSTWRPGLPAVKAFSTVTIRRAYSRTHALGRHRRDLLAVDPHRPAVVGPDHHDDRVVALARDLLPCADLPVEQARVGQPGAIPRHRRHVDQAGPGRDRRKLLADIAGQRVTRDEHAQRITPGRVTQPWWRARGRARQRPACRSGRWPAPRWPWPPRRGEGGRRRVARSGSAGPLSMPPPPAVTSGWPSAASSQCLGPPRCSAPATASTGVPTARMSVRPGRAACPARSVTNPEESSSSAVSSATRRTVRTCRAVLVPAARRVPRRLWARARPCSPARRGHLAGAAGHLAGRRAISRRGTASLPARRGNARACAVSPGGVPGTASGRVTLRPCAAPRRRPGVRRLVRPYRLVVIFISSMIGAAVVA